MLIICPTCSSSYLIRATEIGRGGRLVRCGACKNSWQVEASGGDVEVEADGTLQTIDTIEENGISSHAPSASVRGRQGRRMAIGGLAIAAVAAGFVMPLGKIADAARALIDRVMPVDRFAGIDFENVTSQLVAENDEIFLVVEGQIIARQGDVRVAPGLALTIRGEGNDQIFRWTAKPPAETISPGTPIAFKVRLASPPITGREVSIRFVDASEVGDASAS